MLRMAPIENYFNLPPHQDIPIETFNDLLSGLTEASPEAQSVKANIHLEVASTHAITQNRKSTRSVKAWDFLKQTLDSSPKNTPLHASAEVTKACFPAYLDKSSEVGREKIAQNLATLIRNDTNLVYAGVLPNTLLGRRQELLAILLLGHAGLKGIIARPSFARQESSTTLVDGKKHNWDVTAISDGSVIAEGHYCLQVKSYNRKKFNQYHPSIVRVSNRNLGIWSAVPRGIQSVATAAILYGSSSTRISEIQKGLLKLMHKTGPLATSE